MAKKKEKVISRAIEIEVNDKGLDSLIKLANSGEGKDFGIFPMPDGSGGTFGRPVEPPEYEGEGLQDPGENQTVLFEESLTIDIRYSYQMVDKAIVELALKGSGRNFRFVVKDIPLVTVHTIAGMMLHAATNQQDIVASLANLLVPRLIGQLGDRDLARRVKKQILDHTDSQLRRCLGLARYKEKRLYDPRGFLWAETQEVFGGRDKKTAAEVKAEKIKFLSEVNAALEKLKSEGGKITKSEAGAILYPTSNNPEKTLENALRSHGLSWKSLKNWS